MRQASNDDLEAKLGPGNWAGSSRIPSIRERIKQADPDRLRRSTLFVATVRDEPVGSVIVSTVPPGFWRRSYWSDPKAGGLGVFALVVHPEQQRSGVGTYVMRKVESLAKHNGIPYVRLDAYSRNPISNDFYEAIGYDRRIEINLRGTGLVLYEKRVIRRAQPI